MFARKQQQKFHFLFTSFSQLWSTNTTHIAAFKKKYAGMKKKKLFLILKGKI